MTRAVAKTIKPGKRAPNKRAAKKRRPKNRRGGRKRALRFGGFAAGTLLATLIAGPLLFVVPLRFVNPPTSAFILAVDRGTPRVSRSWVPLDRISAELQVAVIASEDQKFPTHNGFDVAELSKAIDERLAGERSRGASTITQQVAKNLYFWSGHSFLRKALEAYVTTWIEWSWTKRRILEIYLNIAEFGPGVFGVGAASELFFHKPARGLTAHEAALLAAVLPNPKRMSAIRPSAYVLSRAAQIEAAVRALGGVHYLREL